MKIAIIYHKSDYDGILSNEVCRYWLKELHLNPVIHSYGWNYGDPLPSDEARTHRITVEGGSANSTYEWEDYDLIYIVDLSVDELMSRPDLRDKIVWIDHHKTAIEKYDGVTGSDIPSLRTRRDLKGYRIDGVAACRLCWQWFAFPYGPNGDPRTHPCDIYLPSNENYVNRNVSEPRLIRLAGEYDIWDHRDRDAATLQLGLRSISPADLDQLIQREFAGHGKQHLRDVLAKGRIIQAYVDQDAETRMQAAYTMNWEGLRFLCLNGRGNSLTFRSRIDEIQPDALLMWYYDGNKTRVSLYHAPGHEDIDLSVIAKKHGGGGHRGACGFEICGVCYFPVV